MDQGHTMPALDMTGVYVPVADTPGKDTQTDISRTAPTHKLEKTEVRRRLIESGLDFLGDGIEDAADPEQALQERLEAHAEIMGVLQSIQGWTAKRIARMALETHPPKLTVRLPDGRRAYLFHAFSGSEGKGANGSVAFARINGSSERYLSKSMQKLDDEIFQRFQQEAYLMRIVGEEGAPGVEADMDDNGIRRIFMKLKPGVQMGKLLEGTNKQGLPPQFVQIFAKEFCRKMKIAHRKGIVHRDVKEHNTILGDDGQPLPIDWGEAKKIDDQNPIAHTRTGESKGTVHCLSPEIIGSPKQVSTKSDMYSMGRMLFRLATGRDILTSKEEADRLRKWESFNDAVSESRLDDAAKILPELKKLQDQLLERTEVLAQHYPPKFILLLKALLSDDPNRRPDAGEMEEVLGELVGKDTTIELAAEEIPDDALQISGFGTTAEDAVPKMLKQITAKYGPLVSVRKFELNGARPKGDSGEQPAAVSSQTPVIAEVSAGPEHRSLAKKLGIPAAVVTLASGIALTIWLVVAGAGKPTPEDNPGPGPLKNAHTGKNEEYPKGVAKTADPPPVLHAKSTTGDTALAGSAKEGCDAKRAQFGMVFDTESGLQIADTRSKEEILSKGMESLITFYNSKGRIVLIGVPMFDSEDNPEFTTFMGRMSPKTKVQKLKSSNVRMMFLYYTDDSRHEEFSRSPILETRMGWAVPDVTGGVQFESYSAMANNAAHPRRAGFDSYHKSLMDDPITSLKAGDAIKGNIPDDQHQVYISNATSWLKSIPKKLSPLQPKNIKSPQSKSVAPPDSERKLSQGVPVSMHSVPYTREQMLAAMRSRDPQGKYSRI